MTTHDDLDRRIIVPHDRPQPTRGPDMRAYCATLSRFAAAVRSAETSLHDNETTAEEEHEERERVNATRLRRIRKAQDEAEAGQRHVDEVRAARGMAAPDEPLGPSSSSSTSRGLASDLGVALTSLARRRDELRVAVADFDEWNHQQDTQTLRRAFSSAAGVGLLGTIALIIVHGQGPLPLALAIGFTFAAAGVGLWVAVTRRLPQVCSGQDFNRVPDTPAMARFGGAIAAVAGIGLIAVSFLVSSL